MASTLSETISFRRNFQTNNVETARNSSLENLRNGRYSFSAESTIRLLSFSSSFVDSRTPIPQFRSLCLYFNACLGVADAAFQYDLSARICPRQAMGSAICLQKQAFGQVYYFQS